MRPLRPLVLADRVTRRRPATPRLASRRDSRLELINDDAHGRLRDYPGTFDVIIGDLNDPVDGGPCYQLYTDDFYKTVVAAKLSAGGLFVTQSGPAGILSAGLVFASIHNTLKHSFARVVPYSCHVPSFADEWVRFCGRCGDTLRTGGRALLALTPTELGTPAGGAICTDVLVTCQHLQSDARAVCAAHPDCTM